MGLRRGFTLIEIMVSVVIISTVVMTILQLFSNNTRFFLHLDGSTSLISQASLLIGAKEYGFESKKVTLYDLVEDFDVDDDVRRALKSHVLALDYIEVMRLDGDDLSDSAQALSEDGTVRQEGSGGGTSLEIGRTTLESQDQKSSFLRIKLQ